MKGADENLTQAGGACTLKIREKRRTIMLPKQHRINKSEDFARIYKTGRKTRLAGLLIFRTPNTLGYNRFGFVVSKKVGNSVVRHHTTRILREAVYPHILDGSHDYMIIPQKQYQEDTVRSSIDRMFNHNT